ncbi:cytochrome b [Tropicimonas sp.]|uniref:cytochrome b n=1 Tax=Tropicimonas sp. TaxID=2067044 RepID=UPI003A8905EC
MGFFSISAGFTRLQKQIHWIVTGLIALQYLAFDGMGRPFNDLMESGIPTYDTTVVAHIAIGVSVLALTLWRLAVRMRNGAPAAPAGEPEIARKTSKVVYVLFYVLTLLLPLSGMVAWFGMAGGPAGMHEAMTSILMLLILLHVAAVLVHQYYWKTNVLHEML